jgi:aromatic ring-opening dioxygenase catalytic subunit (LigB family)
MTTARLPTLYLPHGGGPCFFMEWTLGPPDTWNHMATWLRSIGTSLPRRPQALLVISAHWEEAVPTVMTAPAPPLLFDYYGFPPHTYQLKWPAPGSPELAARVRSLLSGAGIESAADGNRGFDHGVFVPLLLAFPSADVPTVQLSLRAGLDPAEHIAIGRALAPLRNEGVFLIGSGMSFHNMRAFMTAGARQPSLQFDDWLAQAVTREPSARDVELTAWKRAPSARECHPREEHLLPLMVTAGAAGEDRGRQVFKDEVMGVAVSAVQFG